MPMRMKSTFTQPVRQTNVRRSVWRVLALCAGALFLAGCGLLSGPVVTPTSTRPMVAVVPTFTSTPEGAMAAQESGAGATTQQAAPAAQQQAPAATDTPAPTDTPVPTVARFTVKTDLTAANVNVRTGPSTAFNIIGTVARGAQFDISGRNQEYTWFQFCCVAGQTGWIFSNLVNVENAHLITLAQNIPPTPVPPTATPIPPTPVPVAPAPSDPCAGIGGDGCKFRIRNGPSFSSSSHELKLRLGFVHERHSGDGQDGKQAQGQYSVGLTKEGVGEVNIRRGWEFDSKLSSKGGHHGKFNYEYKLSAGEVGGTVAGNYTIWVIDGVGERDSQNFSFTVPEGQGEVWIVFAQNN